MSSIARYRSAVVVGAGRGLGRELALRLASRGYIVFGTAVSAEEVRDLREASGARVSLIACDVTRTDSTRTWAEGVSDALDSAGLNVLFCISSRSSLGPIEVLPLEAIRREFESNVFGALSIIKAFFPALRAASGRIIQISDWTASKPLPFDGPSAASKAAIDAILNAYRAELRSSGIEVVIAPTSTGNLVQKTTASAEAARVTRSMTREQQKRYGKTLTAFATALDGMGKTEAGLTAIASGLVAIAEAQHEPSRAEAEKLLCAGGSESDREMAVLLRSLEDIERPSRPLSGR